MYYRHSNYKKISQVLQNDKQHILFAVFSLTVMVIYFRLRCGAYLRVALIQVAAINQSFTVDDKQRLCDKQLR